jgi:hypothetical protein
MDRSDIKSIITLSSSSFYREIIQKYQTGKKKTSRLPKMIFYKERVDNFPKKISMVLNFRLHLDQQNIVPVLVLKNISVIQGRLSRLKTERKTLQSILKLNDFQSTNNIAKISQTAFKTSEMCQSESEFFPTENFFINKNSVFSFLKSLSFRDGNITNDLNKILNSSFSPVNDAFYQQKTRMIFSDILTLNPKTLNYKNNMKVLNSQIFEKKIYYRFLNNEKNPTFIDKENELKYWPAFEDKSPSNYLEKQNTTTSLIVKNIPVNKEIFSWLNSKKNGLKSLLKPKDARNINDVANVYVSQAAFKISQGFHARSELFLTGNISINKISVFPFLKSLIFRAGNITNNSNKILNSSFFSQSNVFYQKETRMIPPYILKRDKKIFNYENNMETLNSQIFGKKIYYRFLNIVRNPTFIDKENALKYWPAFEDKSPSNYFGKQNTILSSIVKKISVIQETYSWLNTKKNGIKLLLKPKDAQNISDVANISQAAFKIPQMYQIASGIFSTGSISTNKISVSTNKISVFLFRKFLIFRTGNIATNSNRILKPLPLSENSIYYQEAANSTYSGSAEVSSQMLNNKNKEKILNSQVFTVKKIYESLNITRHSAFINRKSIVKNQLISENKLPAVFLQDNLLFNKTSGMNILFFKESNWVTVNKPFVKNYYGNFEHETPSYVQSNHNSKIRNESLVFQDQGRIEQEIEQIKKTVIETKKSVSEKTAPVFGEADIKKYLDINRISSQVYQNIERTIRMERERRGM